MYQSGRAWDEAKKRKSPAKSGRVGITVCCEWKRKAETLVSNNSHPPQPPCAEPVWWLQNCKNIRYIEKQNWSNNYKIKEYFIMLYSILL